MPKDFLTRLHELSEERVSKFHDRNDFIKQNLEHFVVCMAGEIGELASSVKRLHVGLHYTKDGQKILSDNLEEECADILIYLDLFCNVAGIDLIEATKKKFNQDSRMVHFNKEL